jgi:hypothetical protein
VTITAAGLALIGLTAKAEGPQRSSLAALIVVESAILALGIGLVGITARRRLGRRREALLLATAAGVLFGVSDAPSSTSPTRTGRCSVWSARGR